MKLFVWKDVLEDWTSGLVVVLARNKNEAVELFEKKHEKQFKHVNGEIRDTLPTDILDLTEPYCVYVYGGGG